MIRLPETGFVLGRSGCGTLVREDSFRDENSLAEWQISALSQSAQDRIYLGLSEAGGIRYPIRFGALAAHAVSGGEVSEVAVLPFLFVPATHSVAWEPRFALRIGPMLSLGLLSDLDPMARMLLGHWLRVTDVSAFEDPRLGEWFADLDLLVALDQASLEAIVGACPVLGGGLQLALAEALDWRALTGRPLVPFPQFVRSTDLDPSLRQAGPRPSPLRVCARMGAALGFADGRPLSALFESLKRQFRNPSLSKGV